MYSSLNALASVFIKTICYIMLCRIPIRILFLDFSKKSKRKRQNPFRIDQGEMSFDQFN